MQNLFAHTLLLQPKKSAAWRRSLAARYPDDPRNLIAADELDKLSHADVGTVDPIIWEALAGVDPKRLRDAINEVSRAITFKFDAYDLTDYFTAVLRQLSITIH